MNRLFKSIAVVVISGLVLFASSCTNRYVNKDDKVSLEKGWEYGFANPFEYPDAPFTPLSETQMLNLQELLKTQQGYVWLKQSFQLPENLKSKKLACYLGRVTLADETFLNGTYIGGKGHFPPNETTAWNTTRFYPVPDPVLNKDGENVIAVHIYVNGEGSIVSGPFIGEENLAQYAADKEGFWNCKINLLFAFLMIVIGFYHLMLWLRRPVEKENFHFFFINIFSAMYMSVFYISEIPGLPSGYFPFLLWQKIFSSAIPFVLLFLIQQFVNSYLGRKEKLWVMVIRCVFVAVPVIIVLQCPSYIILRHIRVYFNPLLIPPVLYIVFTTAMAVVKKQKDSRALLVGFSPLLITLILDVILHDILEIYSLPYFSSMGWQLVIVALLFVLARRFSKARSESEYLNIHLQDEVEERTKELTEANVNLLEVNGKLEDARVAAERDMKLAVNVQRNFYPRFAPEVDDWEIAFTFQPKSGVSGDLYDIFHTGKKLDGLCLFDVSGHGISSGLVTMLSKTVIDRCFTTDPDVHVNQIMKSINEEIVEAKGDIENYLTGLLIRTDGSKVQYTNAGHPPIFYRSGKNGVCAAVESKNKSVDGGMMGGAVIGIPGLELDVKSIKFEMKSGDAIILYTDCLSESRNSADEEWGQAGVMKAFAESGYGNARSKLDTVLKKFHDFTSGVEVKDDLTVIVLQKK